MHCTRSLIFGTILILKGAYKGLHLGNTFSISNQAYQPPTALVALRTISASNELRLEPSLWLICLPLPLRSVPL